MKFNKALAPAGIAVVLALLSSLGITPQMTVEQVVSLLVSSVAVYFVPNKKV